MNSTTTSQCRKPFKVNYRHKMNHCALFFLLAISLVLPAKGLLAGEFGSGSNVWITDGVFYAGIKDEIEDAWFEQFFNPNGRTFGGSPERFFLTDVTSDWFETFAGIIIGNVRHVYTSEFGSVRIVNPGNFGIDTFVCPDGLRQEGWTGPNISAASNVNRDAPYCENGINIQKNGGSPNARTCPVMTDKPIHLGTGNKFLQETDYQSSTGGLRFRRSYNSQGPSAARVGRRWFADYWQRLIRIAGADIIQMRRPDGKVLEYRLAGNQWVGDSDVVETLEELQDGQGVTTGWRLRLADDSVEEYVVSPTNALAALLVSITDRNGWVTTVVNDLPVAEGGDASPTSPDLVTDPFGRTIQFKYDPVTINLAKMIDPAGNEYLYSHVGDRQLVSVTYPDETPLDPNDNPTRQYHYEDPNFINHLTGITDETGNRFSNYAYDSEGRAILSELAGGVDRVDVSYNADGTTTVTEANGNVRTYHFDILRGTVKLGNIVGNHCPTCGSQIRGASYDSNGFIASQTDFNGNVTTFINNSRGLETSRTEAVGTAEERTITTEWHSDFRLPTKLTEPGQITTFTYDTQGRLLERQETEE